MRPVNLIPAEERRGDAAPTRSGPLAYIVVGLLVAVLAGVTAVVLFDNRVADRQAEVTGLEANAAETQARAESLSSFASFQQIHDARVTTVDTLARSRFDWERVLREFSRVVPRHVWLTKLVGTVSPDVTLDGGGDSTSLRGEIPGPALELEGCGRSQHSIARLVAAMKDIDGVTRVTVADSTKPEAATAGGSGSCQTRQGIPKFHLIAGFDGIATGASAPPAPAPAPPTAPASTDPAAPPTGEPTTDPGTPSASQQKRIETGTGIAGGGG